MSMDNPLGAPRIHGELLKLGFEVAQSSVAKYMVKRRGPPSQGWLTFVVPTIGFDLLYAFVIVRIDRRELVWINVTKTATAEWVAWADSITITSGFEFSVHTGWRRGLMGWGPCPPQSHQNNR
jgi:hypothetical protein